MFHSACGVLSVGFRVRASSYPVIHNYNNQPMCTVPIQPVEEVQVQDREAIMGKGETQSIVVFTES